MAMNAAVFLGLGAIALLAMMGKGKKKNGNGLVKPIPAEPKKPVIEPVPAKPKEPVIEKVIALLEDYRLPDGYDLPSGYTDAQWRKMFWVSDDCKAWALGKDFKKAVMDPFLDDFYEAYVDLVIQDDPELATAPPDEWVTFQFRDREQDHAIETPAKAGVAQLLMSVESEKYAPCVEPLPEASDFDNGSDYMAAWSEYAQTEKNFYALYYNLWQHSRDVMDDLWQERFPDEALEWMEREIAYEATQQHGLSLEDMTDWAYHHAYPDCPEVIDPHNPEHDECKAAWLRLRNYITEELQ